MSGNDLTRWNRSGLRRLRYVDSNAATLLEALRAQFASDFPTWKPGEAATPAEPDSVRQKRLLTNYEKEPADQRDWGWEIARSFARACHVLLEHVDAYANEGFLSTATQ